MHYYSVFKDQPFWGERKQYSLNPVRVNGSVRILRRSFHRQRAERRPKGSLRTSVPEVKPLAEGKSAPAIDPLQRRDLRAFCTIPGTGEVSSLSATDPAGASLYDSSSSVTPSDSFFSRPGGKSSGTVARPSSPTRKSAAQMGAPRFGIHQMR